MQFLKIEKYYHSCQNHHSQLEDFSSITALCRPTRLHCYSPWSDTTYRSDRSRMSRLPTVAAAAA